MNNIFKLAKVELKNTLKLPLIRVAFAITLIYMIFWLMANPASFRVKEYLYHYFLVVKFVMILFSVYLLGSDFKNETYKYIFTGCFSRKSIIASKIIATVGLGAICWIFQVLLKIVTILRVEKAFEFNSIFNYELFSTFIIYVVVTTLIGSFSILIASISCKLNTTMIFTLFLFGIVQFNAPIFIIGIEKSADIPSWFELIKILPTYIIFDLSDTLQFQTNQLIFMLIYIILCLWCSIFILNKKDLNV